MKDHLINEKLLFYFPFLLIFTIYLNMFNGVFSINGSEYEFMFYEVIIMTLKTSILVGLFHFVFSKFIEDKRILFINTFLFVFALRLELIYRIPFLVFLLISIFYKKNNYIVKVLNEIFSTIFALIVTILFIFNSFIALSRGISYINRTTHYNTNKDIVIDKDKPSPNIYWFHMDGMPNTDFINNYYNEPLTDFKESLNKMNVVNYEDSSFVGGHHTITALNAMINPDYYDNYLKDYLNEKDKCEFTKCKTKYVPTFKNLHYRRIDNELIKGLKEKGYTTISITEYNQYVSLKTDHIYDTFRTQDSCKVPYFKGINNNDDIYKDVLKIHLEQLLKYDNININMVNNATKYIPCNKDINNYKNISKVDSQKQILTAIIDSKDKDNNPKFYFIDNVLIHKYWNYDSEGNFIRSYNTDLNDYDDCYRYVSKVILEYINYIKENDPNSIIIFQGDHGIHVLEDDILKEIYKIDDNDILDIRNSTVSLIYIPEEYKNGNEEYLNNPLNISRYLINNYVGDNYKYIKE